MADRGHHTSSTDNEAVVIGQPAGHRVPDTFGTNDDCKFGNAHAKRIHNDYAGRYGSDSPITDAEDC